MPQPWPKEARGDFVTMLGSGRALVHVVESLDQAGLFRGERLRLLQRLTADPPPLVLTTIQALLQPVPERSALAARTRPLRVSDTLDLDDFDPIVSFDPRWT